MKTKFYLLIIFAWIFSGCSQEIVETESIDLQTRASYHRVSVNLSYKDYTAQGTSVYWNIPSIKFIGTSSTETIDSSTPGFNNEGSSGQLTRKDTNIIYSNTLLEATYVYFDINDVQKIEMNLVRPTNNGSGKRITATIKGDNNVVIGKNTIFVKNTTDDQTLSVDLSAVALQADYTIELEIVNFLSYSNSDHKVYFTRDSEISSMNPDIKINGESLSSFGRWDIPYDAFYGAKYEDLVEEIVITSNISFNIWIMGDDGEAFRGIGPLSYNSSLGLYSRTIKISDLEKPNYSSATSTPILYFTPQPYSLKKLEFICEGKVEYVAGAHGVFLDWEDFTNSCMAYPIGMVKLVSAYGNQLREDEPIYFYDYDTKRYLDELPDYTYEFGEFKYSNFGTFKILVSNIKY